MRAIIRLPYIEKDNSITFRNVTPEQIVVPYKAILSIDGSTTRTGVGIMREGDGALAYSCAFEREENETPVQYKVRLKRAIYDILLRNPMIANIYYEEPFIGYASSVANLMMLRTFVEELIFEYEPQFNYIKHIEVNNKKWKRIFLAPDKCPGNSELEKEMVKKKLISYLPFLSTVSQDEIDAISMGFVACVHLIKGTEDDLESKKKAKPFGYNVEFMGADDDEVMFNEFYNIYTGPQRILENGITFSSIKGTANFDKHIYEEMGQDDKVLIIKFSSNHHGNLILKHRIGHLAASYENLYAIVWRKGRK